MSWLLPGEELLVLMGKFRWLFFGPRYTWAPPGTPGVHQVYLGSTRYTWAPPGIPRLRFMGPDADFHILNEHFSWRNIREKTNREFDIVTSVLHSCDVSIIFLVASFYTGKAIWEREGIKKPSNRKKPALGVGLGGTPLFPFHYFGGWIVTFCW